MTKLTQLILGGTAAIALAACGGGDTAIASGGERGVYELANDYGEGSLDAPVTVVEYASVSCGACANWANTVYPDFKDTYVDTGEVRYIFRPFPASDPTIYAVGTKIALCAGAKDPDAFLENIKLQMEKQSEIFRYAQLAPEQLRDQYAFIAKQGGLSEDEMETCLASPEVNDELQERQQVGLDLGIGSTPTFVINGEIVKAFKMEDFAPLIEAAKSGGGDGDDS